MVSSTDTSAHESVLVAVVSVADGRRGAMEILHDFTGISRKWSHTIIFSRNCLSSTFKKTGCLLKRFLVCASPRRTVSYT